MFEIRCQACKFAVLLAENSDLNFLSYAPVLCPEDQQWIRTGFHKQKEIGYMAARKWPYLRRLNLEAFNVTEYVSSLKDSKYFYVPAVGMATNGGGRESAFTWSGALRAFDSHPPTEVDRILAGFFKA